jgi:DivIVA domain-containing protein
MTPELIQAQSFTTGFRGYDASEVRTFLGRVAAELRAWRERAEGLESAWHSAEERAARPPVLDEDTLMAAVGEETATILRMARSAAAEMRTKAGEEAERAAAEARVAADLLLEEARTESTRLQEEAALAGQTATAAAEEQVAGLLATAGQEAAELVERATSEAAEIRAKADKDRRLNIEGANATRDRILEDLSRRRRVATVQIEQLRAGRERLIESYAMVRRTLEEVQSELSRADTEARAAADAVGRRLQHQPEVELTEASRPLGELLVEGGASPPASIDVAGVDVAGVDVAGVDLVGSAVDELFARIRGTGEGDAPSGPGPAGEGPEGEGPEAPAETTAVAVSVDVTEAAVTTVERSKRASKRRPGRSAAAEPAPANGPSHRAPEAKARPAAGAVAEPEPAPSPAVPTSDVPVPVVEAPEMSVPDADEALLQARERAIVDLETTLTRRLKRALQDEQNDVLDRLRNLKGEPTVATLLPSDADQAARYAVAAGPLLAEAAAAGAVFAGEALGAAGPDGSIEVAVADLGEECGSVIVSALRRRLEQAIEIGAADDQAVLVESLGAAYREWKTQRIERLAGDLLAAAFSRGTWQAAPEGAHLRWVVEDPDGPCPDCDDDALAGDIPKGEPFPTGQHHPPAHSGCRCLLVPTLAGS